MTLEFQNQISIQPVEESGGGGSGSIPKGGMLPQDIIFGKVEFSAKGENQ